MECRTCARPTLEGTRRSYCEECRRLRQIQASRRWSERNADRVQQYRKDWYAANRERERERYVQYRLDNLERIRAYRRELYENKQKATNAVAVAEYRRAHPGKHPEIENRRRARKLAAFVAPVDPDAVYERDGGICQLCHQPVSRAEATMDHVIPLARGGTHEPANVQTAHGPCNSRKGNRLVG